MASDAQQWMLFRERCEFCGSVVGLQVHHVDWNHGNDAPENRMRLCQFCHTAVHQLDALVPEQLRVVRELVELERRLFEVGAPLDGLKQRRMLIDAVVGCRAKGAGLVRPWTWVERELGRIAALRAGRKAG